MNQEHCIAMSLTEASKTYPDVDQYIQIVVLPGLADRPDDGDKATFLGHELDKWERIERKLAEWAKRDDDSPNPYSPPLNLGRVSSTIAELNSCLDRVNERGGSTPQLDDAE